MLSIIYRTLVLTLPLILFLSACAKDDNDKPYQPYGQPNPSFTGRIGTDANNHHILSWAGSQMDLLFTGNTIDIPLSFVSTGVELGVQIEIQLDGERMDVDRITNKEMKNYTFLVKNNLEVHALRLTKLSSPIYGNLHIENIVQSESDKKLKFNESDKKLLFIGDSISLGYGALAQSADECTMTAENENTDVLKVIDTKSNINYSFTSTVGDKLFADYQVIALPGRGLAKNQPTNNPSSVSLPTMPQVWKNIVPADTSKQLTNEESWPPDFIVINLGTSDFANPEMTSDIFAQAGQDFVKDIRSVYPKSKLIFVTGPVLSGERLDALIKGTEQIVANTPDAFLVNVGTQNTTENATGCDNYPTSQVHAAMAEVLLNGQNTPSSTSLLNFKPWQGLKALYDTIPKP